MGPAAGNAESDAERMDAESDADGEQQVDKSTGKKRKSRKSTGEKRKYAAFQEYRELGGVKSDGGPPDKIPNWNQNKLTVKFTCS